MKIAKPAENPAPSHLSKRSKMFWSDINARFVLESHDLERLRTVCESMDTVDQAEAAIRNDGLIVMDRYKCPKPHPAAAVSRDARVLMLRAMRELNIDIELPSESRIPSQKRRYG